MNNVLQVDYIEKVLSKSITNSLSSIGLLYRLFSRVKSDNSIKSKQNKKNYDGVTRHMQDLIGYRVTTYFPDDVQIVTMLLKSIFELVNEEVDQLNNETFKPTRTNLVFRLPHELALAHQETVTPFYPFIDSTFEIQVRTVLSEGWHEVEHDLRYKCSDEWKAHSDLSRALNGIYATLETSEWSMLKVFEEKTHRHYKAKDWKAMLRSKFRVRFQSNEIDENIITLMNNNESLAKKLFRVNRNSYLTTLIDKKYNLPVNYNNLIFSINYIFVNDKDIDKLTPSILIQNLSDTI